MNAGMNVFSKPRSLYDCLNHEEGTIDPVRYFQYQRHYSEELNKATDEMMDECKAEPEKKSSRSNRSKRNRGPLLSFLSTDGKVCSLTPNESSWYRYYVESPNFTAKFHKAFRRRFRLPYAQYQELV